MITQIEMVYGFMPEAEKTWIENNLKYLNASERENYLNILRQENPARKGKPTVQMLQKVLTKTTGKKPPVYFWSVCVECGCEYDYKLTMCPACYEQGFECRVYAVKTSETGIPSNVIRYNKTVPQSPDGEKICYDCEDRELSYCRNFGNPDWYCKDFQNCKCASCCVKHKKFNAEVKKCRTSKITYRIPLKKAK